MAQEATGGAVAFDTDLGHAAQELAAGRFQEAAYLGRYTIEEAREGHEVYAVWSDRTRRYLLREGPSAETVAAEDARLAGLLRLDDGSAFDDAARWSEYNRLTVKPRPPR